MSASAGEENSPEAASQGSVALADFLAAPIEQVRAVAPHSVVYAPGGTRRSALFHGITPWTAEYVQWAQAGTLTCLERLYAHGVRHVFLPLFMAGHIREVDDVESQLARPAQNFAAGKNMLGAYQAREWRVRLIGGEFSESLRVASEDLRAHTAEASHATLWWMVSRGIESQWAELLAVARALSEPTQAAAIRAYYHEDIPPVTLLLAFGKPSISREMLPPFLEGDVQCYWSQHAGYSLSDYQVRRIFYDYAYARRTWTADKTRRAASGLNEMDMWQSGYILGLGMRLGSFWYPGQENYPQIHIPS